MARLRQEFPTDAGIRAQVVLQAPPGSVLTDPPQADAVAVAGQPGSRI
ncbi:hypothetical protein [Candidatus Poriferisodalis sp.]